MGEISIEGIRFFAYHGCQPEEQTIGNHFVVDIHFFAQTTKAEKSDDLNDTIDYSVVYDLVKEEMKISSKLLEHVGRRIMNALRNKFQKITKISVRISKLSPPINGEIKSVSVTLEDD